MPDNATDAHDRLASTVFEAVLDGHPALTSIEEVVREVARDPARFGDRDAVNNAIRDLVKEGLLHRTGDFVFVTRTAIRARELCI
jgi:hypothetical protein